MKWTGKVQVWENKSDQESNQSRSCRYISRTHPQTRNKQLSLQTTWWDNERIINHTCPLCTHLLTGKITETKAFTEKMVIKSNKTIGKSVDPTTLYLAAWDFIKLIIPSRIYNESGSRSWTSKVKVKLIDLTEEVFIYVTFDVSMNKICQRLNMLWPIV